MSNEIKNPKTNYKIHPILQGLQKNTLRIEVIQPMVRCSLKPRTWQAVIVRDTRPLLVENDWSSFDYCTMSSSHSCEGCPFLEIHLNRVQLFQDTVIRRDEDGWWHLMNHPEKGWDSYSYQYKDLPVLVSRWAIQLLNRERDETGVYYPAIRIPKTD